jgi:hypothetical protein
MRTTGPICGQCNDAADVVTPFNGSALLAKTVKGEIVVALHKRCEGQWADKNNCQNLVPLKKMRRSGNRLRYIEAGKRVVRLPSFQRKRARDKVGSAKDGPYAGLLP